MEEQAAFGRACHQAIVEDPAHRTLIAIDRATGHVLFGDEDPARRLARSPGRSPLPEIGAVWSGCEVTAIR